MSAPLAAGPRAVLRRFAPVAVFGLAVWAVAATSPSYSTVPVHDATGELRLDADHPVALARVRVGLNAEATAAYGQPGFTLVIEGIRPAASSVATTAPNGAPAAAHVTVMAAAPDPGEPDPRTSGSAPEPWQAEASQGVPVVLPVVCRVGPCERAFWLIAQLDPESTGALDVDWRVGGSIGYGGDWPKEAAATIVIDPPIVIAGPAPAISATTDPDTITIGPGSPAAARVIEVGIGAEALVAGASPGPGAEPGSSPGAGQVAALSVDVRYRSGLVANTQTVLVRVVPLADTAGASSDASPLPDGADPFAGCPAGKACSRRFLVAFAWTGYDPQDEELDWTATIRRTDLLGVWTTPATLGAKVTRRIDLADAAPAIVHAEGDVSPASTDRGPQVQLRLASRTTSDDPIAALLPVPASYTYRARLPGPSASPAIDGNGVSITARIPDAGTDPVFGGFQGGSVEVRSALATRTGACRVGQACPDLDILISSLGRNGQTPPPGTTYHWTLDVAVRSYVDVPVEVTLTP